MKRRIINNLVALIPEWVVQERGLNDKGRKVGNGYILNQKELSSIDGDFFEHKVALLGGVTLSPTNAKRLIDGTLQPIVFTKPIINEELKEEEEEV